MEKLRHEFEAIGFYLSAHPLDSFGSTLKRLDVVSYVDLPGWIAGRPTMRAKLAGIVTGRQERTSAKGSRFAFVQLSDASGMYEVVVFSETLAAHRELLEPGTPVLLTVDVRLEPDNVRLTAQAIQGLEAAAAQTSAGLKVYLSDSGPIPSLKQIMERCGRGRGASGWCWSWSAGGNARWRCPGAGPSRRRPGGRSRPSPASSTSRMS
jgi:DNA polymerase III, alpha subunit